MQRDDDIAIIKASLDELINNDSSKIKYEAIMAVANHSMNLDIHIDDNGHHQVLWYNRKLDGSFDENLSKLVEYINDLNK